MPVQITHQQWLTATSNLLSEMSATAELDSRVILCHCLQKPLSYLLAWPERAIIAEQLIEANVLKDRRLKGEPIAYIVGNREFWSMDFKVTTAVLIPRPETELMVEWALECIEVLKRTLIRPIKILELGTGSGVIAIALAREHPELSLLATDISVEALDIAKENARNNACHNVEFIQSNWFEEISSQLFDIILTNPPYIASADPHLLKGDVSFEPVEALVSGDDGLTDIGLILSKAKGYLHAKSWLAIEHGYAQSEAVLKMMQQAGYLQSQTIKDLAGLDRLSICSNGFMEVKSNE